MSQEMDEVENVEPVSLAPAEPWCKGVFDSDAAPAPQLTQRDIARLSKPVVDALSECKDLVQEADEALGRQGGTKGS